MRAGLTLLAALGLAACSYDLYRQPPDSGGPQPDGVAPRLDGGELFDGVPPWLDGELPDHGQLPDKGVSLDKGVPQDTVPWLDTKPGDTKPWPDVNPTDTKPWPDVNPTDSEPWPDVSPSDISPPTDLPWPGDLPRTTDLPLYTDGPTDGAADASGDAFSCPGTLYDQNMGSSTGWVQMAGSSAAQILATSIYVPYDAYASVLRSDTGGLVCVPPGKGLAISLTRICASGTVGLLLFEQYCSAGTCNMTPNVKQCSFSCSSGSSVTTTCTATPQEVGGRWIRGVRVSRSALQGSTATLQHLTLQVQ